MSRPEKSGEKKSDYHARAHWVSKDCILWAARGEGLVSYKLLYHDQAQLNLGALPDDSAQVVELTLSSEGPPPPVVEKAPYLGGLPALQLPVEWAEKARLLIKSQVMVAAFNHQGALVDATYLQIPRVLDELFFYGGPLGVCFERGIPMIRVWAPTARRLAVWLFPDAASDVSERFEMEEDSVTGVWQIAGEKNWTGQFYLFEVEVFVPLSGRFETHLVTDPYSVSLATNSRRSQIIDLDAPDLHPKGWKELVKPPLDAPEDIVLYELHVRDFSIRDSSVPKEHRGTFMAFTSDASHGMQHLRLLADAGLTHIHLLPVFDFASVNEDLSQRVEADPAVLATYPPDSDVQQALVSKYKDDDGFNWGYDPYHYSVPEGSYSTDPNGSRRILEFRHMVKALNEAGLRVVMDVVYNHTFASGKHPRAVLDRIVPGYYHRLNGEGTIELSTCCPNTASEHAMMEKLMIDSLLLWAKAYKIDGFRFDLMGHHTRQNMERVRQALNNLTLERDGVDGRKIYLYGEGWNFGEMAGNGRGVNASQLNTAGLGIGTFNDRFRDAVRGGRPFGGLQEQGFVTGLYDDPNELYQGSPEERKARLLQYADWIRLGLAGNLRDYVLVDSHGHARRGAMIDYHGQPAAYTADPEENILYISAHDNETLFDAIQLKAPAGAGLAVRVRMHNLAMSLLLLAQGIPFIHAGDEMLRSKSLDRNSYNSGDWFNQLDYSYQTHGWGNGLPPGENYPHWPLLGALLARTDWKPQPEDIQKTVIHVREMLSIRRSSNLFRLHTAAEINRKVRFFNTGPEQVPGLIVMLLSGSERDRPGQPYEEVVVLFNATRDTVTFADVTWKGRPFQLHPIQAFSYDEVVRRATYDVQQALFMVPGRTAAVFIKMMESSQPLP